MNSWLVWTVFAAVAIMLGAVGYHFSVRTLRWVALIVALATVAYLISYGLTHSADKHSSLSAYFARSADTLSSALIRPLSLGHPVPTPGRIGWLVIVVLLVFGYRELEAWTLHRQAPCLDVSELTSDRQDNAADTKSSAQTGKQNGAETEPNAETGKQLHDWLVAELKFRLPAVEVRAPAILPGGSRPSGLASIAEATGVSGAGLAGAIIRFFGMVWPSSPKIQVRVWVERAPGQVSIDGPTRVTVGLADPGSGAQVATQTLAVGSLDHAVAAVAGYVARHIFARDCTVPPWSVSMTDGADLAALLLARQVRGYPENCSGIQRAQDEQIELLGGVAQGNLCAGVVRYELAQLHDLTGKHDEALLLHAANREQYPRFYRGRYRLAMSLEMLANPHSGLDEIDMDTLRKALQILDRCCVTHNAVGEVPRCGQELLPDCLRRQLLAAARQELQAIQRYLTWRHIIWGSLRYRNERAILLPYLRLRHRQAFHDGVCVALLLVAIRQAQLPKTEATKKPGHAETSAAGLAASSEDSKDAIPKLGHAKTIARIAAAISGDSKDFTTNARIAAAISRDSKGSTAVARIAASISGDSKDFTTIARIAGAISGDSKGSTAVARITAATSEESKDSTTKLRNFRAGTAKPQPITRRLRTRRWPWQCRTPSWPAAYNLACAYAALGACADTRTELDRLVRKVICSLEFAFCNPECEMERPSEWIGNDPDFRWLCRDKNERFTEFLDDQRKRDYPEPPGARRLTLRGGSHRDRDREARR